MHAEADRYRPAEYWWREFEEDADTVVLTVRIPAPIRRYLEAAAKSQHVTISDLTRSALLDFALVNTTTNLPARRGYLEALYRVQTTTEEMTDDFYDDRVEYTRELEDLVEFAREALRKPPTLSSESVPQNREDLREVIRAVVLQMRADGEL